jgi:hypothetical protein
MGGTSGAELTSGVGADSADTFFGGLGDQEEDNRIVIGKDDCAEFPMNLATMATKKD